MYPSTLRPPHTNPVNPHFWVCNPVTTVWVNNMFLQKSWAYPADTGARCCLTRSHLTMSDTLIERPSGAMWKAVRILRRFWDFCKPIISRQKKINTFFSRFIQSFQHMPYDREHILGHPSSTWGLWKTTFIKLVEKIVTTMWSSWEWKTDKIQY